MKKTPTLRWKTLLLGLALIAAGWTYVRFAPRLDESMFRTGLMILCVLLALLWIPLWVLLLSGLRWKPRLLLFVAVLVVEAAPFPLLRVDGFEGDVLPQLSWKWEPKPGEVYDPVETDVATWREDVPGALDVPEFLGRGGTNHVPSELLPVGWETIRPTERWRHAVGLGWSSFAVARGLAITQEQRGDDEAVVAYALDDGTAVWTHRNSVRFSEPMGSDGPRATPTIAGGHVVVMGATGRVDCLDFRTGEAHWSRDVLAENGHANLEWGKSGSPLVVGELVIVTLGTGEGGSLAAYDLATGEPRWRSGEYEASYATPVLRTIAGQEQVVVVYADHLAGHLAATGEELWSTEIPRASANVANPVVLPGDQVLVTIGYGKGSRLFEVQRDEAGGWSVAPIWRGMGMKTKFTNPVVQSGYAFGLDEGRLSCIDLATGRRLWKGTRWGHGQVLGVGDRLLVQVEDGSVAIVEASPAEERVLLQFDALDSKTWNQPVLAGRYLLVRNDREAICFAYPEP